MLLLRQEKPFTLSAIFSIIHYLTQKQPEKYLKLDFTSAGIGISTFDDSHNILLGIDIKKEVFHSYIVEKDISLYFPVAKFDKILHLPTTNDDSITLTYQHDTEPKSMKQLSIRIHSKKNNEKLVISMKIASEFGEMISQKYEQPTSPIDYYNNLIKGKYNIYENNIARMSENFQLPIICQFEIPAIQFMRICSQFMEVTDRIAIQYQSQRNSNKKYLTFTTCYENNAKSVIISEQKLKPQLEYEESKMQRLGINKINISSVFAIEFLLKICQISRGNEEFFKQDIKIVLEYNKCILVVHELVGDCGRLVSMLGTSQI